MNKQSNALRLAGILERPGYGWHSTPVSVAYELRRLHTLNTDLLEFAEEVRRTGDTRLASMAIALIVKTTGEQQ